MKRIWYPSGEIYFCPYKETFHDEARPNKRFCLNKATGPSPKPAIRQTVVYLINIKFSHLRKYVRGWILFYHVVIVHKPSYRRLLGLFSWRSIEF